MLRTISLPIPLHMRQVGGRLLGIAAIIMILVSGYGFRWQLGQPWIVPHTGLILAGGGMVTLGAALLLLRPTPAAFWIIRSGIHATPIRWLPLSVGVCMLVVMAEANGTRFFRTFALSQHIQAGLFVYGIILATYGLGGFEGFTRRQVRDGSLILLLGIMLLALALRVWNLGELVHIMVDEQHFYDGVVHLWENPNQKLLQPLNGIAMFPHLFSYLEQATVAWFGADFAGMRVISAVFGTLTIPAVYVLGRALGDAKTGLLAAFALAVLPAHIHFSRLALNNIADPLFGTLAFACLVNGLRYNRQRDYVLAGACLGMTAYFYEGGRLVFPGVLAAWLGLTLVLERPWSHRRGILLMGIMAAIVFMPYYYATPRFTRDLTPRLTSQGALGYLLRDLRQQPADDVLLLHYERALRPTIFHTIYSPDSSEFYYGGYTGILQWYVVPFYLLGLCYALFRMRGGALLWLWIVLGLIGLSFTVPTDSTVRFCVLFPAMAVVVAIGLRYPLEALLQNGANGLTGLNGGTRANHQALMAVIAAGLGLFQLHHYFGEHMTLYQQQVRVDRYDFYDAFDRATAIPDVSALIYITEHGVYTPVIDTARAFRHVKMDYAIWRPTEGFADKLAALPRDQSYVFVVAPEDTLTLNALQATLPLTQMPWSVYSSVPLDRQYPIFLYDPSAPSS